MNSGMPGSTAISVTWSATCGWVSTPPRPWGVAKWAGVPHCQSGSNTWKPPW